MPAVSQRAAHSALALAYNAKCNYPAAVQHTSWLIAHDPQDGNAHALLAAIYANQNQSAHAAEDI